MAKTKNKKKKRAHVELRQTHLRKLKQKIMRLSSYIKNLNAKSEQMVGFILAQAIIEDVEEVKSYNSKTPVHDFLLELGLSEEAIAESKKRVIAEAADDK